MLCGIEIGYTDIIQADGLYREKFLFLLGLWLIRFVQPLGAGPDGTLLPPCMHEPPFSLSIYYIQTTRDDGPRNNFSGFFL